MSAEKKDSGEGPVPPGSTERSFTGRSEYVRKFVDMLERQNPEESRVLVYHGMGGIGKTRLAKELGRVLDGENELEETGALDDLRHHSWFCWAKVDFRESNHRKPAQALYHLRTRLLEKYGFRFPTFDIAFAEYWSKRYSPTPLPKPDPSVLEEHGDLIVEISNLFEEAPGLGVIFKLLNRSGELSRKAEKWYRKRNEEALQGVPSLQAHEIEEYLPRLWTYDFKREISQDQRSAVFFFDTYEALREDRRSERHWHRADQWIREWVTGLEDASVLITGRHELRWSEVGEKWEAILEQHEMEELGPEDSRLFLKRNGVEEEAIRERIVEASSGIPYDLELAVDFYEEIKGENEVPKPEDFGETPRKLSESFFRYLGNNEMAMLELLAVPRSFDRNIVEALTDEFDPGFPAGQFVRLKRFSFVNQLEDDVQAQDSFSLHERAREALREHAELFTEPERVHKFLFDYYREKFEDLEPREVGPPHEQYVQEAFYHGQQSMETKDFSLWFHEKTEVFDRAARWQLLETLTEKLLNLQEITLGEEEPEVATTLINLAKFYREQGSYERARDLCERALEIRESAFSGEHPKVAEAMNQLAEHYRELGRYEEADLLYDSALEIREKAFREGHPEIVRTEVAETLDNLAELYRERGKYEDAVPLYRKARKIWKEVDEDKRSRLAETLNNLGLTFIRLEEYRDAERLLEDAIEIWEGRLGRKHPRVATGLNNLGLLHLREESYKLAISKYKESIEIREYFFGKNNPEVTSSLVGLATVYLKDERYEDAEEIYKRALDIEKKTFGERHPEVAVTLGGLSKLYLKKGEYGKAEPICSKALKVQKENLGKDHPRTQSTEDLLKRIRDKERR